MSKQIKNVSLVDFKATNDGKNGGFSAYATIFSELDDVGDIILPGAYKDTIPQFLKKGFIARSHDWSTAIGMPVRAREDKTGLIIEAQYHSTDEAQNSRTITNERQAAGLESFVSIGYEPAAPPVFVLPKDYQSELPRYVRSDLVDETLQKAKRFSSVRVLSKLHLYEISLVQVPALQSAVVMGAKSRTARTKKEQQMDIKGLFADEIAERENDPWFLWSAFCCVLMDIQNQDEAAEQLMLPFDYAGAVTELVQEFAAFLTAALIAADVEEDLDEAQGVEPGEEMGTGTGGDMGMGMGTMGRKPASQRMRSLVDGRTFEAGLKTVVDAVRGIAGRAEKRVSMRTKEGRVLSTANWDELQELYDRLGKLLENAKPKPKEEAGKQLAAEIMLAIVRRDAARRGVTLK